MMTFDDLRQAQALHNEHNDCTVKALAVAGGMSYAKAHGICKAHGRRYKRGMSTYQVLQMLDKEYKVDRLLSPEMQRLKDSIGVKHLTANNITKALKRCGYGDRNVYAMTCDHAIGIRQGQVIDWTEGRRNRIKSLVIMPAATVDKVFRKLRHRKAKRLGLDPKTGQPV